jgi:hypothetical protein
VTRLDAPPTTPDGLAQDTELLSSALNSVLEEQAGRVFASRVQWLFRTAAAIRAGDDGGAAIARLLPSVSSTGIPCTSFGQCLDVLRTENDIDYDGISGPVDLGGDGDVAAGSWTVYTASAGNVFAPVRTVIAG